MELKKGDAVEIIGQLSNKTNRQGYQELSFMGFQISKYEKKKDTSGENQSKNKPPDKKEIPWEIDL